MTASSDSPKVFISYSWKPILNKQKTIQLAERLESDGVDVIIDIWNLAEGQDKFHFMEQMVNDLSVKKVLIVCNKDYATKANEKFGGVGIESLIVSNDIYRNADQTKFIPIIFERDEQGQEYVPTFINSRIYIDLSNDEHFEEEYEKLLRNLYDRPLNKRPPKGNPPPYITEESSVYLRTSHKANAVKNALLNEKRNFQVYIDDYYSTFIEAFEDFNLLDVKLTDSEFIDDLIYNKIEHLKVLRDDFIIFLEIIFSYSAEFNLEKFISFIENILDTFKKFDQKRRNLNKDYYIVDHFKFFLYEVFLYTTTIMIEKEKFKELGSLLQTNFIISNDTYGRTDVFSFAEFRSFIESLDTLRNQRLQLRRKSITADLIKQRADNPKYNFEKLKESDAILYYISLLKNDTSNMLGMKSRWFPVTSVYSMHNIKIIEKTISKRYFEKIKYLFGVDSKQELENKIKIIGENKYDNLDRWDHEIPYIASIFDFDKIATIN